VKGMGAILPGLWQPWQFFTRIGSTSRLKVTGLRETSAPPIIPVIPSPAKISRTKRLRHSWNGNGGSSTEPPLAVEVNLRPIGTGERRPIPNSEAKVDRLLRLAFFMIKPPLLELLLLLRPPVGI
jgi:hypothetical protein